ncbi:MAG: hypothetical protein IH985_09360, partial [Planctomycetes bacterium]|nr:hypothetical protein [Planctomycetota bacterium]
MSARLASFANSSFTAGVIGNKIGGAINDIISRGDSSLTVNFTDSTITGINNDAIEDLESIEPTRLDEPDARFTAYEHKCLA